MLFIESDSDVLVLVTQTRLILGSSVGGTVAFMASICQLVFTGIHGSQAGVSLPRPSLP